jgi:UDP-N-acetylglucosamine acyltransferase
MPRVHSTTILEGDVDLADDAEIGPQCVLDGSLGRVVLGERCKLRGHIYLTGPLTIGEGNTIYPFTSIGFAPQDFKWKPDEAGAGVVIGSGNTFRENVTIHRATSHDVPTTIGDGNFFMSCSHAGHDCRVGSHCVLASGAMLGGHARVDDRAIIGGLTGVHQHVRIGRSAMLSGCIAAGYDVPPFFMLTALNLVGSLNMIGLRRSGATSPTIDTIRWVYKTIYRRGLSIRSAVEELRTREDDPLVMEYIEFIESSKRGICSGRAKAARGAVALEG